MKFIKAHIWLYEIAMKSSIDDLDISRMTLSFDDRGCFEVLLQDDLIYFDNGKYRTTDAGSDIVKTVEAFREL